MYVNSISLPTSLAEGTYTPALDTTGTSSSNLVTNEQQSLAINALSNYEFTIPSYAPFYANSLVLAYVGTDLITNSGNPFIATTGWSALSADAQGYGGGSVSIVGPKLRLTNSSTGTTYGAMAYEISVISGKQYQINVVGADTSNAQGYTVWIAYDALANTAVSITNSSNDYLFTATQSGAAWVFITSNTLLANSWVDFSSISVQQYTPMVEGVDYYYAFPFIGASRAIGSPIFGGVRFANNNIAQTVQFKYQSLGGSWTTTQAINAQILLSCQLDPCAVAFEQVMGYNSGFPIITTAWDRTDPTNLSQVNTAIRSVASAFATNVKSLNYNSEIAHISNFSNPHNLTANAIGLGEVANLPPATNIDIENVTNNATYVNPAQVKSMMINEVVRATSTISGVVELNVGIYPGDDSSGVKVLTASGFTLLASNENNALSSAVNKGQVQAFVTPFPLVYPIQWNGNTYATYATFQTAVEEVVGVTPLEFDTQLGCFWLPANAIPPALVVVNS